jgi:hypothetical protein
MNILSEIKVYCLSNFFLPIKVYKIQIKRNILFLLYDLLLVDKYQTSYGYAKKKWINMIFSLIGFNTLYGDVYDLDKQIFLI